MLLLAGVINAAAADNTITTASLLGPLKERPRSPIVRADLNCNSGAAAAKSCMDAAKQRGNGWTCQYVEQWQQWCMIPPGH